MKWVIDSSRQAFESFRFLSYERQEVVTAIALNSQFELLEIREIFRGTIDKSLAQPREILQFAFETNAAKIVIGHNHPSGNCFPSDEDCEFTHRLWKACELMGIPLLDHLVVGGRDYFSFADSGQLKGRLSLSEQPLKPA